MNSNFKSLFFVEKPKLLHTLALKLLESSLVQVHLNRHSPSLQVSICCVQVEGCPFSQTKHFCTKCCPWPQVTEHAPLTGWVNCPQTAVSQGRQLAGSFSAHSWAVKFSGSTDSVHWHAPYSIGHGDRSGQLASSVLHRGVLLVSLQTKHRVTVSTPLPHDEEHSLETGST